MTNETMDLQALLEKTTDSDFLRQMTPSCQWRFDVLAIYYERDHDQPSFELFQNAFTVSYNRSFANS